MKPNVSVIIPVLNEEESIAAVLGDIPAELAAEVIVVDNGCTDRTVPIARSMGAKIVAAEQQGYGAACYAGTVAAGGDILVYLDGDYSDYPAEMTELIKPIAAGRADLVIGSRYVAGGSPLDKAGAYGIQDAEMRPVARLDGCYASVMGLPLCALGDLLQAEGLTLPDLPATCSAVTGAPCCGGRRAVLRFDREEAS